jgi:hypothetical protein
MSPHWVGTLFLRLLLSYTHVEFLDHFGPLQPFIIPDSDVGEVMMAMGDSVHYDLHTSLGADEWSQLIPDSGTTVIHLTSGEVRTVAMLHQLQCLDYLRLDYIAKQFPTSMSQQCVPLALLLGFFSVFLASCLNYLRQSVLCHAGSRLEPLKTLKSPGCAYLVLYPLFLFRAS